MIHQILMERISNVLTTNETIQKFCTVVSQNEQELATLLKTEESKVEGVVIVICVDQIQKLHTNPFTYRLNFTLSGTEFVPLRVEGNPTALDLVWEAAECVDAQKIGHFVRLTHTTPGDGVLEAVAEFEGDFQVSTNE